MFLTMSASPATMTTSSSSTRRIKNPVSKAKTNQKPGLGKVLSTATVGFLSSSRKAHSTEESWSYERLKPSVDAFIQFMKTSGLDLEISNSLNLHLLPRLGLLSQIQTILNKRNDRRELSTLPSLAETGGDCGTSHCRETITASLPAASEALRYMKYATACYGSEMIQAAQIGKNQSSSSSSSSLSVTKSKSNDDSNTEDDNNIKSTDSTDTITGSIDSTTNNNTESLVCISDHIGIPPDDIVLLDIDYSDETNHNHLRHFVAVDHGHSKVVLAIRGTYNLSEIVVDITAFSRPCHPWGGEAHAEILGMAKRLWHEAVGSTILELLEENPGYELILTGHSLGAGCASIMNMMMQYCLKQKDDDQEQEDSEPQPQPQPQQPDEQDDNSTREDNDNNNENQQKEESQSQQEKDASKNKDDSKNDNQEKDNNDNQQKEKDDEDNDDLSLEDQRRIRQVLQRGKHKIRCFAFACPPLFTPLEIIPEAVQSTTNYILEQDIVPFLSVDSVRHVFHAIRTIEDYIQTKMTTTEKMNLTLARTKPPQELIDAVHQAAGCRLKPKEGAPILSIPAKANVWMKERPCGEYDYEPCDSMVLSWLGLNVNVQYFPYHLPPRYEHALEHLMDEI